MYKLQHYFSKKKKKGYYTISFLFFFFFKEGIYFSFSFTQKIENKIEGMFDLIKSLPPLVIRRRIFSKTVLNINEMFLEYSVNLITSLPPHVNLVQLLLLQENGYVCFC